MGFIALKCPNCQAAVELDDTREFGFCQFCGTKIVQDKTVVEHRGSVKVDNSDKLENLLLRAEVLMKRKAFDEAEIYYNKVLEIDALNQKALDAMDELYKIIYDPNVTVKLEKGNNIINGSIKIVVKIDGKKIDELSMDEAKSFVVPVGKHTISAKMIGDLGEASADFEIIDRFTKCVFVAKSNLGFFRHVSISAE